MENMKNIILTVWAFVGATVVQALGGWDGGLKTLCAFMLLDVFVGCIAACVYNKSAKTKNGGFSSRAAMKGFAKKLVIFALVALGNILGAFLQMEYIRMGVIMFFIGNEGMSICETVALIDEHMVPAFIRKALEVLKEKGDNANGK